MHRPTGSSSTSHDCSSFGSESNFVVTVYQGNNPADVVINELRTNGNSSTDVYREPRSISRSKASAAGT
jgi:hypothetical protein